MRTKTTLLTAALVAAGALSSMAQVYSVNVVGYINLNIPHGFSMIANQLNASPNNTVVTLFPSPPDQTTVFKYNAATRVYDSADFADGAWEGNTALSLGPGEGAFIYTPVAFPQTFVGEVQNNTDVSLVHGFQIVSSPVPQSAAIDAAPPTGLGYVPAEGDFVYQFVNDNVHPAFYISNDYADGSWEGTGNGASPVPAVGEAFWLLSGAVGTKHWTRTFVVGPP